MCELRDGFEGVPIRQWLGSLVPNDGPINTHQFRPTENQNKAKLQSSDIVLNNQ
jgi:hypothetical protein